ncbi:MAG TPA: UDP-N-acetylmuramoyl-L-alanine--D-glutamate ligase [Deltaproteobacteria bacterium]|nr:UDP-N-acetylmuramoyl-L-alanine--D-glutamate ligase [Deltaproteobacteria bacterium]
MMIKERILLTGKKIVVVGLGVTGTYAARFLARCGAEVVATDLKPASQIEGRDELEEAGVKLVAGGYGEELFRGADLVVVSPGVRTDTALFSLIRTHTEVVSDVELVARFADVPIIAVTGTNGKTTTTSLVKEILTRRGMRLFTGGNIGVPALKFFEEDYELCLFELSSFQLENISTLRPTVSVLLNITEDHMDRYSSFSDYVDAKFRIFMNQKEEDHLVVNFDDPVIREELERRNIRKEGLLPFSLKEEFSEGVFIKGGNIICRYLGRESVYPTEGIKLEGIHNLENIMAAIGVAAVLGVDEETIKAGIYAFRGLPHRMEFVRELEGVRYINDSKSTNTGSLKRALEGFAGDGRRVVLIAGGKDKGMDFSVLKGVVNSRVKALVLIGEAKEKFKEAGFNVKCLGAEDLEEAVLMAREEAAAGDTVLLSPGCASFDMFRDFEHRGNCFKEIVRGL